MENNQFKHAMRGAWVLSLGALVAKILSAVYRVPFQNLVGDTGFYVYQQVYPLYGIGMTFALSGFPVFISKLVAEAPDFEAKDAVTHRARVIMTWLGVGMFGALELGAGLIAKLMADPGLTPLIQSVGLMFLTMPLLSTARGYFQGTFDMTKTAVSQVVEQVIRVAVILLAAWFAVQGGWDVYKMGTWAMSGAFFGGLGALLVVWPAYHRVFRKRRFAFSGFDQYAQLMTRFVREGGAITLFAAMLILLQLVDSFTVTRGLVASGVTPAAAKALKGVYDRGQPLVQLGLVVATSFSASLLPALTRAVAQDRRTAFRRTARQLVHFNFGLSLAAAAGLIALMPAVNRLLFGSTAETPALRMYALSIVLVALINADNAILQSLNHLRVTAYALAAGFLVKLISTEWFTFRHGTLGAAFSTVLSLTVIFAVLHFALPPVLRGFDPRAFNLRLCFVVGVMSVVVHVVATHMPFATRGDALILLVVTITLGVLLFVVLASWVKLYTVREVLTIPFGRRFMKAWRKLTQHS